jgi:ribosomal RNA assembly protein
MYLRIPRDRVAALLGKNGKTKAKIEKDTGCAVKVEGNDVTVEGEPVKELRAGEIVKAIGRGFAPKDAMDLLSDDMELIVITLEEKPNVVRRLMGRVIGRQGKSRLFIERMTGARIAVKGKTVAIIGDLEGARVAERAVDMLLEGRTHAYVWKRLEKMVRESKSR